ncbi:MAG: hypothetical protein D3916_07960 [Candidatus Electrothrix sp. MAN1_4]|nr:hypothetical protein [Candidatus Electrothrix sp. MAN1_4]
MEKSIQSSSVLSALNFRVRALRGRFYYERSFSDDEFVVMGRVTPLVRPENYLLLEFEHSKGNWKEVAEGEVKIITHAISGDRKGTFHGLGALNKSIHLAEKEGTDRLKIIQDEDDDTSFSYAESNQKCGVQEVLYHYFGVPIPVIAEPRDWYIYHRTPSIREVSANNEQILVDFTASDMYGDDFGGTCLYVKKEQQWDVFTIKPNQSGSIESALAWLEKRKWKEW